jgi:toxin ParE1/3/4
MSATLHIFKSALDDLQTALDWYDSQSAGLEKRFSKEINDRLAFISQHPEASSIRAENFRGTLLKKFPYTIYYDFDELQNVVFIAAVLHNKRDRSVLGER